jgi:hypothetical protein
MTQRGARQVLGVLALSSYFSNYAYYVTTLLCYATTLLRYATMLRYYATTLRYYATLLRYYATTLLPKAQESYFGRQRRGCCSPCPHGGEDQGARPVVFSVNSKLY